MDLSNLHGLQAVDGAVDEWPSPGDRLGDPSGERDRTVSLREFLVANYARLHRRLCRHLGCPDLASDCLHDAWLRLGESSVFAAVQSPEAYVYRTACNVAMDRLRGDRTRPHGGDDEALLDRIADHAPGPDLVAEARSDLDAVVRAIEGLPSRYRAVLIGLRINEWSRQEVAARYGLSLRTVDTSLRRALEHCTAVFTPRPPHP